MPESFESLQVFEIHAAEAGVESDAPTLYSTVRKMREQLTSGKSSARQQLAQHKPRFGAHLSCCKRSRKPGTTALLCMQQLPDLLVGVGLFGFFCTHW